MHGLGDSADGFLDLFMSQPYELAIPEAKVMILNAPIRPVTVNNGMKMRSW